jgi:hypothetical protein
MGTLKPGATYIYERDKDTVYAREFGADPSTRKVIGWDYQQQHHQRAFEASIHSEDNESRKWRDSMMEDKLWGEIRRAAPTNPSLQKALDRAIMIYRLSKDKPL